jgi:hypothetical protein
LQRFLAATVCLRPVAGTRLGDHDDLPKMS